MIAIQNDDLQRIGPDEALRFLLDSGLLFEINRSILHPYGLALNLSITEAKEDESEQVQIAGLLDYRDDPEGIIFAPETYEQGLKKYEAFWQENQARLEERVERLGFIVQPKADPWEEQ
ncbi:MAG: hypothetical protein AB1384_12555 [Actinomycetota bacterium]